MLVSQRVSMLRMQLTLGTMIPPLPFRNKTVVKALYTYTYLIDMNGTNHSWDIIVKDFCKVVGKTFKHQRIMQKIEKRDTCSLPLDPIHNHSQIWGSNLVYILLATQG